MSLKAFINPIMVVFRVIQFNDKSFFKDINKSSEAIDFQGMLLSDIREIPSLITLRTILSSPINDNLVVEIRLYLKYPKEHS